MSFIKQLLSDIHEYLNRPVVAAESFDVQPSAIFEDRVTATEPVSEPPGTVSSKR